jgi:hypothetical protein
MRGRELDAARSGVIEPREDERAVAAVAALVR